MFYGDVLLGVLEVGEMVPSGSLLVKNNGVFQNVYEYKIFS
jgi:hypothetical protein